MSHLDIGASSHQGGLLRTTLDLDEDILERARLLARQHGASLGKEVSRLVRKALEEPPACHDGVGVAGFEPFPAERRVVTDALVDGLRDQEGV